MSHGPFGLGGGTLAPAPACWAIINVAPISVSASASIRTSLVLVFMFILFALLRNLIDSSLPLSAIPESDCNRLLHHMQRLFWPIDRQSRIRSPMAPWFLALTLQAFAAWKRPGIY